MVDRLHCHISLKRLVNLLTTQTPFIRDDIITEYANICGFLAEFPYADYSRLATPRYFDSLLGVLSVAFLIFSSITITTGFANWSRPPHIQVPYLHLSQLDRSVLNGDYCQSTFWFPSEIPLPQDSEVSFDCLTNLHILGVTTYNSSYRW